MANPTSSPEPVSPREEETHQRDGTAQHKDQYDRIIGNAENETKDFVRQIGDAAAKGAVSGLCRRAAGTIWDLFIEPLINNN